MKPSPFAPLNETVPTTAAFAAPPQVPAVPVFEPVEGGGMFGGPADLGGMATDPPDIGKKTRQLLWEKGTEVARVPGAGKDRFCCINGPCKYYGELHIDDPTCLPQASVKVLRLCRRFIDDDGATLEMTDATLTACLDYSPPWWSPDGWRMKMVVAWRLTRALERISGVSSTPFWQKMVKWHIVPAEVLEDVAYGRK
jgi:hypothetical protein